MWRFVRGLAFPLFILAAAALALVVFHVWGLGGTAILLALWGLSYVVFLLWHRRTQRQIRERFAQMSGHERVAALAALSEADRAEVLDALKRNLK